jgi:hypothetical protein
MGVRTKVFGQPDKARQPLTHPQLAMMHFVYEIRVTLSTKKFMFFGPAAVGGGIRVARQPRCPALKFHARLNSSRLPVAPTHGLAAESNCGRPAVRNCTGINPGP